MSFELILPFLRPIEPLLLDESISEIMGNPDASWWYERDGIIYREADDFLRRRQAPNRPRSHCQPTRQTARRRQPCTARAAPGREPPGGGDSAGCSASASTHHPQVHQPPLHSR